MKINKRDLILDSIISAYLDMGSPIGSNELMGRLGVAASTIRVYFKQLSDEGAITQLHISGGRIPTERAMQLYWASKLSLNAKFIAPQNEILELLAKAFGLYFMIFGAQNPLLKEVSNHKNRLLMLDFGELGLCVQYDRRVERFLANLVGTSLNDLQIISAQVGYTELKNAIIQHKMGQIFYQKNEQIAIQIYPDKRFMGLLRPDFAAQFYGHKIAFNELFGPGFMGLCVDSVYANKPAKMIVAGSIYADFGRFLTNFKEAV